MFQNPIRTIQTLAIAGLILASGCDDRATQIAREAANRQAQQNTAMAKLNTEVASGAHQLLEADSESRKGFVEVHRDLQAERRQLDAGWNSLEAERKQIAGQRRTESAWVPIAQASGACALTIAVLGYCWYALSSSSGSEPSDALLNVLLVDELLSAERPTTLGQSARLDERSAVTRLTR